MDYRYKVERKRGNLPLPLKINKMQIITIAEQFMSNNFEKNKNGGYALKED